MKHELGRRAFLKGAGVCAAVGASAGAINLAGHQNALADHHAQAIGGGTYDFDAIYNRVGTNSVKWDRQIAKYGADNFKIRHGNRRYGFQGTRLYSGSAGGSNQT